MEVIREVYRDNFIIEIKRLSELIAEGYNHVTFDTEFPGVIYQNSNYYEKDFYYKTIKVNVDNLNLIQLGIALTDKNGRAPKNNIWQFNLKFDLNREKFASDSISMLMSSGINFNKLKTHGIAFETFAEYIITSGLILNDEVTWITFHGIYDFAYLLRLITNKNLPDNESEFFDELELYFNKYYDIRYLIRENDNLKGSLQKLSCVLNVNRVGMMHQAGSDSKVTSDCFYILKECDIYIDLDNDLNCLFGFEKCKISTYVIPQEYKMPPLCEIAQYQIKTKSKNVLKQTC
jgi:CCR4-NOT transcription complex subunit 7/8